MILREGDLEESEGVTVYQGILRRLLDSLEALVPPTPDIADSPSATAVGVVYEKSLVSGLFRQLSYTTTDHLVVPPVAELGSPDRDAAQRRLIGRWAGIAASHATASEIEDPKGFVASVSGVQGPWAFGLTRTEAIAQLESVLVEWASLKLEDGDDDIPSMEGVDLVLDR